MGREEANIKLYKEERERKKRELKAKYMLMKGEGPELLAAAVMIQPKEYSLIAANIREIKRKGIEEVIKCKLSQGRKIEVKSFSRNGNVEMASNEWLMTEMLRDRYCYILSRTHG